MALSKLCWHYSWQNSIFFINTLFPCEFPQDNHDSQDTFFIAFFKFFVGLCSRTCKISDYSTLFNFVFMQSKFMSSLKTLISKVCATVGTQANFFRIIIINRLIFFCIEFICRFARMAILA